jgi:hypothetical protein
MELILRSYRKAKNHLKKSRLIRNVHAVAVGGPLNITAVAGPLLTAVVLCGHQVVSIPDETIVELNHLYRGCTFVTVQEVETKAKKQLKFFLSYVIFD